MSLPSSIKDEIVHNLTHLNNTAYFSEDADDHEKEANDLTIAKVSAILILGILSFLIGIIPSQLFKWTGWNLEKTGGGRSPVLSLMLCFGGGVLMFTTFLHLLPENKEAFERLFEQKLLPDMAEVWRLPELIFCMGFFFVYLIEEIVHTLLDHKHEHTEEEAMLHRTMSLRQCSKDLKDPPTLIPRASLCPPDIMNKQILIDSSSNSSITDNCSPDLDYLPKVITSDHILAFQKTHPDEPIPKFIIPAHHHSHIGYEEMEEGKQSFSQSVRAFCTVLALSFHAVFEGLAVGLESSVNSVWYMAGAIAAHKFVISFCVGIELLNSKTRMYLVLLYIGTFAIVTPIGIGVGIGLSHGNTSGEGDIANAVLQAMAAGTLLYVVFFEVLQRERTNGQSGILQLMAIMAGFGVMFGLGILTAEGHHHSHGDHNPTETDIKIIPSTLHNHHYH